MVRLSATTVVLALLAPLSLAADGVLEINQACATSSTGCFPGDTGGFPVTITEAGSYRLTGNLTLPLNTTAIAIDASLVTLDLGGFLVSGANVCTGYPVTGCTVTDGNPGIRSNLELVVVRNGSVRGMGGPGIVLAGPSSEVENVRVLGCGANGIHLGYAGRTSHSFSGNNLATGIYMGMGGTADDNEVRANHLDGLFVGQIQARLSGSATRNRAFDNGNFGINGTIDTLLSKNVASSNTSGQIFVGKSLGDNLCTGTLC